MTHVWIGKVEQCGTSMLTIITKADLEMPGRRRWANSRSIQTTSVFDTGLPAATATMTVCVAQSSQKSKWTNYIGMKCRTNARLNLVLRLCHTRLQRRQWECEGQLAEVRAGKRGVCCSNALQRSAALERHNITFIPQSWRIQGEPSMTSTHCSSSSTAHAPHMHSAACTAAFLTVKWELSSSS